MVVGMAMGWTTVCGAGGAALALGAAAWAAPGPETDWAPDFTATPRAADAVAALSPAARAAKVRGEVDFACVATDKGTFADCKVLKETPQGLGFGESALKLARLYRFKPVDSQGVSVAGRVFKDDVTFLGPNDAQPEWLQKPTPQGLAAALPIKAGRAGVGGRADILCRVTVEGFLDTCKVRSESPGGYDFGAAALHMTPQFRMKPALRDGQPVASKIGVSIIWEPRPPTDAPPLGTRLRGNSANPTPALLLDPPWTRAPVLAEVEAVYPAEAQDLPAGGQAALRCGFDKLGVPKTCDLISEIPRGKGFGQAARALAPRFAVSFSPDQASQLRDFRVDIPFRFRNPSTPEARKLTHPTWIRTLSAEGMASLYPAAALKAGVTTG
ncbi:MAG: TonB family protein, partial [Caulobacter sp.]|nr:TonB family protein [Caulobacter sp.]